MTAGVFNLLRWMKFRGGRTGQLWWSQKRMAEELKISVRTLQRYMFELTQAKLVEIVRRGRTSALYVLSINCVKALQIGVSNGVSKQLYLFTEKTTQKEEQPATPPESVEITSQRKQPQSEIELPPPTITNEYGRTDPNPAFLHVQHVLRGAQDRISRARNPYRYVQAIIRGELGIVPADHCERERRLAG